MKSKLFKTLGPLGLAFILLAGLIFLPINIGFRYSKTQLINFAQNPKDTSIFTGYSIKKQILSQPDFLPIIGSSELEHVDPFHPSSYFSKYSHGFTPYLVGQPGTTPLTHFFYLNSVASQLNHRKMVYIISPQWFSKQGTTKPEFSNFVSKGEIFSWLKTASPHSEATVQLAQRLLTYPSLKNEGEIYPALIRLSKGQALTSVQKLSIQISLQFWQKEDLLFSGISQLTTQQFGLSSSIQNYAEQLPDKSSLQHLENIAYREGKKAANNNPFQINNGVWSKKIKPTYKSREGKMGNVTYLKSPEYTNFQQVLNSFAAHHDDVLFVIQPVNGSWYSYSGLPEATLQAFSAKIRAQLNDQGFHQIADFTGMYNTPYAVDDTIHFGYRGWLAADQSIKKFMKTQNKVNYHLDNSRFLSPQWATDTQF